MNPPPYRRGLFSEKNDTVSPSEKSWEEIDRLLELKKEERKKETVDLILEYFRGWRPFKIYTSDLSEEQSKNWEKYSESQKNEICGKIRKMKLEKILKELNRSDIVDFCQKSEYYEIKRKRFIELITLLSQSAHSHFSQKQEK